MKLMSTLVVTLAFALGACAGSQSPKETKLDDEVEVAETLSDEDCAALVDHIVSISGEIDRDTELADCGTSGTRAQLDCVMAAEDQAALDVCRPALPDGDVPDDTPDDATGDATDDATGDATDDATDEG